jgi:hypothetical protein
MPAVLILSNPLVTVMADAAVTDTWTIRVSREPEDGLTPFILSLPCLPWHDGHYNVPTRSRRCNLTDTSCVRFHVRDLSPDRGDAMLKLHIDFPRANNTVVSVHLHFRDWVPTGVSAAYVYVPTSDGFRVPIEVPLVARGYGR